jgi:hypothetical protein
LVSISLPWAGLGWERWSTEKSRLEDRGNDFGDKNL